MAIRLPAGLFGRARSIHRCASSRHPHESPTAKPTRALTPLVTASAGSRPPVLLPGLERGQRNPVFRGEPQSAWQVYLKRKLSSS
jgi:hypothetical protein